MLGTAGCVLSHIGTLMLEEESVSKKVVYLTNRLRLSAFEGLSDSVISYILFPDFISNVTIFCQI